MRRGLHMKATEGKAFRKECGASRETGPQQGVREGLQSTMIAEEKWTGHGMVDDAEMLSRRERERLRHKQEILFAALRLFSARGFHKVSMQEIASAAEFATGTLYRFFPNKDAIYNELVETSGARIAKTMAAILDQSGTEVDRLANYFRSLPALLEEDVLFMKLPVSEAGTHRARPLGNRDRSGVQSGIVSQLHSLIEAGIRQGRFRRVHSDMAALAINATVKTLAVEMAGHFDKAEATELFTKLEQLFLQGLLAPKMGVRKDEKCRTCVSAAAGREDHHGS
jgi:TetR/AcrR family transcriptional regulator